MKEKLKALIRDRLPELISIRRHIHQHPELSFQEYETMKYISGKLSEYDVSHTAGVAVTGIVGVIGTDYSNCVALRADIDALPMFEKTDASYTSIHDGVMHACGHDVHTTCLIGAAMALQAVHDELPGSVKLIFQPAEEKLPGGAQDIIAAGVLTEDPVPSAIYGLHVHPPLQVGRLGFKPGMFMASADELTLTFKGKGGHAAVPREFIDPVVVAATFIMQAQQIVSRKANPAVPTVISFGHIETRGGAYNIIPEEVVVKGTLRTLDESWRTEALQRLESLAVHVASASDCDVDVQIIHGYPCLNNDIKLTQKTREYAENLLGHESVKELPFRMSAEDFARYTQQIPGVFFRLGVGNPDKGITAPVHSPYFNVDEEALYYGASSMAWFAYSYLLNHSEEILNDAS